MMIIRQDYKIIVVEKFDDTKMLIKTDNKLPD